jgi:hypothetical protein
VSFTATCRKWSDHPPNVENGAQLWRAASRVGEPRNMAGFTAMFQTTCPCDRTTCRRTRTSCMNGWCEHERTDLDNVAENLD